MSKETKEDLEEAETLHPKIIPKEKDIDEDDDDVYVAPVASDDTDIEDDVVIVPEESPDSAISATGRSVAKAAGQLVVATEQILQTNHPFRMGTAVDILEDGYLVIVLDNGYSFFKPKDVTIRVTDERDLPLFPNDETDSVEKTYSTLGTMMKGKLQIMLDRSKFEKMEKEGAFRVRVDPKSDQKIVLRVKGGRRVRLEMSVASHDIKFSAFVQVDTYRVLKERAELVMKHLREVRTLKRTVESLENKNRDLERAICEARELHDVVRTKGEVDFEKLRAARSKANDWKDKYLKKEDEVKDIRLRLKVANARILALETNEETLKTTIDEVRSESGRTIKTLHVDLEDVKKKLAVAQDKILLNEKNAEMRLRSVCDRERKSVGVANAHLAATSSRLHQRTSELESFKRKIDVMKKYVSSKAQELEDAKRSDNTAGGTKSNEASEEAVSVRKSAATAHRVVLWVDAHPTSKTDGILERALSKGITVVRFSSTNLARSYLMKTATGKHLLECPDTSMRCVVISRSKTSAFSSTFVPGLPTIRGDTRGDLERAKDAALLASDIRAGEISIPILLFSDNDNVRQLSCKIVRGDDIENVLVSKHCALLEDFVLYEDRTLEVGTFGGERRRSSGKAATTMPSADPSSLDDTSRSTAFWSKEVAQLRSMGFTDAGTCVRLLEQNARDFPRATATERISAIVAVLTRQGGRYVDST